MTAPLLREFLLERKIAQPLLRERRPKLRFRCVPLRPWPQELGIPGCDLHLAADGFASPDEVNPAYVSDLSIDDFLRATIGFVDGDPISVRDLVDYAANAAGGVHYDDREKGNGAIVRKLHETFKLQGIGVALYSLLAVGRVTVAAFAPLADAVRMHAPGSLWSKGMQRRGQFQDFRYRAATQAHSQVRPAP